ncbi:MAG TPA: hypothetical protein VHL11_25265 [Phototrophicaceae bacterium]|jgi:hypothetical protein|nr:hypothetical protein [Phototrophicaceae bacterium]
MNETVYVDLLGDEIILTDAVRDLVVLKHPEVADWLPDLEIVLRDPDEIRQSDRSSWTILYCRVAPDSNYSVVVVVQQLDLNMISTIYLAAREPGHSGEVLWQKNA